MMRDSKLGRIVIIAAVFGCLVNAYISFTETELLIEVAVRVGVFLGLFVWVGAVSLVADFLNQIIEGDKK